MVVATALLDKHSNTPVLQPQAVFKCHEVTVPPVAVSTQLAHYCPGRPVLQVAAIGLDPHKHLGKTIHQLQPHLRRLRDLYGCNVCGEGGEYETLTLDCPAFKFGRIVLDDWQVDSSLAGSACMLL